MLDFDALKQAPVVHEPFHFLIADHVVKDDAAEGIRRDFPRISGTGSFPLSELKYGPAFGGLVEELTAAPFRQVLSARLGTPLDSYVPIVTVRGKIGRKDGGVHTDSVWKIATVLLYLNDTWENTGGRLRLLRYKNIEHTIT